jgi:serine/threonine protein kinase
VDGEVFGRYRLHEVLRWGGMGAVYRAHDTLMTREVAIKVLPAESANETRYQEQFRNETSIAAQLNNPNIIPIYEAGEIDGRLYLVMPVLDGIDAQKLLRRDGPMSPRLAVRVIEQAATALAAAHESGLVHGDVRPSNLFVVGGEFVYLLDFGVAAHAPATDSSGAGVAAGSWPYLAPERLNSDAAHSPATARTDIYALACVLYKCLTGQQAVTGASLDEIVAALAESGPPKPTDIDAAIPTDFDTVVARGMAKDPYDR